jgi:hypothetical protein
VTTTPRPPSALGARGKALWKALHVQHPALTDPERELVLEACKTADHLDQIETYLPTGDPFVMDAKGTMSVHPGFVEARQQANILKQLIAALRLPDEKTGQRPQHRGGERGGVYKPRGGTVTALDRARAARGA